MTAELQQLDAATRDLLAAAKQRGLDAEVLDAEEGYLALSSIRRRNIACGALSKLTTAVAASWCDDRRVARRLLGGAGLSVPRYQVAKSEAADTAFLDDVGALTVQPLRRRQGAGTTTGVTRAEASRALGTTRGRKTPRCCCHSSTTACPCGCS